MSQPYPPVDGAGVGQGQPLAVVSHNGSQSAQPLLRPETEAPLPTTAGFASSTNYNADGRPAPRLIGDSSLQEQQHTPLMGEHKSIYDDGPGMQSMQSMNSMTNYAGDKDFQQGLAVGEGYSSNTLFERTGYHDDEDSEVSDPDSVDPYPWMTMVDVKEADDYIHDPSMKSPSGSMDPWRGFFNIGTMVLLTLAVLMLFAGYPILHRFTADKESSDRVSAFHNIIPNLQPLPDYNPVARANSSVTSVRFNETARMLIDPDTPADAYTLKSTFLATKGKEFQLVFSDEFNTEGRSFYAGDDPFWEAVDLHYWATGNFEWYDPAAVYTKNGTLRIRLEQHEEHNLYFRGGMLQSWNKFCFRNGILIASVQLPGFQNVAGLWPAFWIMGNLGRAGYGASLQGTWPYSYDACDVGTVMNQTLFNDQYPDGFPAGTTTLGGATMFNQQHKTRSLSFLPGQKLSRCTCLEDKDMHPGPIDKVTGELIGRSAPEIDVFEAQTGDKGVAVSQSCQMAPYNWQYNITHENSTDVYHIFNFTEDMNQINSYNGEITQQSLSGVHMADQGAVQHVANDQNPNVASNFATYSLEYRGGPDGYVAWTSGGQPAWELYKEALIPDSLSKVSARQFPREPMYILLNLGISRNFGDIQWDQLIPGFPFEMSVDWVRVYQDPDDVESDIGCDPEDMPTKEYINKYIEAYTNPNYTIWGGTPETGGYGQLWPRNKLYSKGCRGTPSTDPGDPDYSVPPAPSIASASVTKIPGAQGNWVTNQDGVKW